MSFYAKYRPQTVATLDLVGVREQLQKIIAFGKISHAYLFCGPKGTGKTSSARILAKAINCLKNVGKIQEPCNKCENCTRITSGASLSVIEMDAASNRGIDDIRALRERVGLAPAEGRYTVYIIDEVHMLTTEAFNALLKTLEEPPDHAIFFLCTTDPEKIPGTIISRVMEIKFAKASVDEVKNSLQKALNGEKIEIEEEALLALSNRVDGSFRDGMKMLEQLSVTSKKITLTEVDLLFGFGGNYKVENLLEQIIKKNVSSATSEVMEKVNSGVDPVILTKRLLELARSKMIKAMVVNQDTSLVGLVDLMMEAAVKCKNAVITELPLLVAIGKWSSVGGSSSNQAPIQLKRPPETVNAKFVPPKKAVPVKEVVETTFSPKESFGGTLNDISEKWPEIMKQVRLTNHSLEAFLKSTTLKVYDNGWLTIEAFYKFHKEQLEAERNRRVLEGIMAQLLGGSVLLQFVARDTASNSKIENISGVVEDDTLVKAAEEIFGA